MIFVESLKLETCIPVVNIERKTYWGAGFFEALKQDICKQHLPKKPKKYQTLTCSVLLACFCAE